MGFGFLQVVSYAPTVSQSSFLARSSLPLHRLNREEKIAPGVPETSVQCPTLTMRFPVIAKKFPVPLKYFPVPLRREFTQKLVLYQQLTRSQFAEFGSIPRNSLFFPCLTGNLPARPQRRVRLRLPAQPTSLHSHCPTFGHSPIA